VSHLTKFDKSQMFDFKKRHLDQTIDGLKCKSHEYKVCKAIQGLQLVYWSTFHLTKFQTLKF
jgi:hypothetical protein